MTSLKAIARDWLPPAFMRWIRTERHSELIRLEGEFNTWEDASEKCPGYSSEEILAKVLRATLMVKEGKAVFERDSVVFSEADYNWPALAGLLWGAARDRGDLNVLDFGGSLGSSYFQNRKILQTLSSVTWNVVEQPHYVKAGRAQVQDENLRFYLTIEECLKENHPNVILLSSVLQYVPDPWVILDELAKTRIKTLILDRTTFSLLNRKDAIRLQHVPEAIYKATYPCRVFNEDNLCQFISSKGYELLERFDSLDSFDADTYWRGHLFYLRHDGG